MVSGVGSGSSKTAKTKNPAEFFADNQNIAGFDNPGKALYTTVRELVENSLDACDTLRVLPNVDITLTELSHDNFAVIRGLVDGGQREDTGLYQKKSGTSKKKKVSGSNGSDNEENDGEDDSAQPSKGGSDEHFFRLTCRDNGCGMLHEQVPGMFGRVLSGTNYAVKQARGKFGLGAKMALIWSKKSTGLPIEVLTGHALDSSGVPPKFLTYCKVDIDIHKNEPKVYKHDKRANPENWRGAEVTLVMSGNFTSYKRRILDYMQQLAVITPYASFRFAFESQVSSKKSFVIEYPRNCEDLCAVATEVKHHPKAVDDLLVRQLLSNLPRPKVTGLAKFLNTQFSCIDKPLANRLAEELAALTKGTLGPNSACHDISNKHLHQLAQLLRDTTVFPDPKADCLSPAGEYNLRLGIIKEFNPELVATARSKPGVYNGHPFLVEAAVALGSQVQKKPGVNVFRFANRIPLLFEPGSDVVSIVSTKNMKWGSYLINDKVDKVGVFVSIVSTKIPFKGTGKEYIGFDVEPIRKAVHECLVKCAGQLKAKVAEKRQARERANRMNNLVKYIPDVSRALNGVVSLIKENALNPPVKRQRHFGDDDGSSGPTAAAAVATEPTKNPSLDIIAQIEQELLHGKELSVEKLSQCLEDAVNQADMDSALELEKKRGRGEAQRESFFLLPKKPDPLLMAKPIIDHPVLALRLFAKAQQVNEHL